VCRRVPISTLARVSRLLCALSALLILVLAPVAAQARLRAPGLQSPANGATVEAPPPLTWGSVKSADHYEVQVAANAGFTAPTVSFGTKSMLATSNTAATPTKQWPDGTYYWRVRAVSRSDTAGKWSPARRVAKAWETAPLLQGGDNLAISWPLTPLVLKWSIVPHAQKYLVTIATDDALSSVVLGTATKPVAVYGNVFALPTTLAPGDYSWAVTPVDSDDHHGQRSALGHFHWAWPTTTTVRLADLDPDPRVTDPQFSWDPVPGAAEYEVEVNASQDFAPGSKWCCTDKTIGTSLSPKIVLANNAYYARVRAFDAQGNAGVWNALDGGDPFTKQFDDITPSIPNLRMVDTDGNTVDISGAPTLDSPIVAWDPVPGASRYEVSWGVFKSDGGSPFCHYGDLDADVEYTGSTAWTPLATQSPSHIGPTAWPSPQMNMGLVDGHSYCVRVLARTDDDAKGQQVVSQFTQVGGAGNAAFTFGAQPASGTPAPTQASDYKLPATGSATTRTPLFTWTRVANARGYFVVVSRDAGFTRIADIGYTRVPAYSPRLSSQNTAKAPLSDETTAYYWAVIPVASSGNAPSEDPQVMSPRTFNKNSTPPALMGPAPGSDVTTQPTFRWTEAENAREYRIQVSQDPTFGSPIDDVITDSTGFTSSSTYPADTQMYWRVRANDWNGQGLNWSQTGTFVRRLVAPTFLAIDNPVTELLPTIRWSPVDGAVSYTVHVEDTVGADKNVEVASPLMTPTKITGTGILHASARANFPTSSGGSVSSGFFSPVAITKTLGPVKNASGLKKGRRVLITWDPDPSAKSYAAEISTTDAFGTTVESTRTSNPSWAPILRRSPGGRLYWRVAPVDDAGGHGAFATGSFVLPKAMRVTAIGVLTRGRTGRVTIVARDAKGRLVKRARVTITGAGIATRRKKTNRKGSAVVKVRPRKRGTITVVVRRKGFADGSATIKVK
jgi:hypothetical protein